MNEAKTTTTATAAMAEVTTTKNSDKIVKT